MCGDIGVLRQVVEARVPLKFVSQMEGVYITQIDLLTWIGEEQIIVDTWQGSLEVHIEEFVTHIYPDRER